MTKILIKRLTKAIKLPKFETDGSSGMDLAANVDSVVTIDPGKTTIIPTGLRYQYRKVLKYKLDQDRD